MKAEEKVLKNFATDPPIEVEVKAFKMVCSVCEAPLSIDELGTAGRPKDWPPDVLGVADCRGCQRVFLVKLPEELKRHILNLVIPAVRGQNVRLLAEVLGMIREIP